MIARLKPHAAVIGFLILGLSNAFALYVAFGQTAALRGQLCGILHRSEIGLPANDYFKTHPAQLAGAIRSIQQQQRDLGC